MFRHSEERLVHYNCNHCQNWWSVGDKDPKEIRFCPYCGKPPTHKSDCCDKPKKIDYRPIIDSRIDCEFRDDLCEYPVIANLHCVSSQGRFEASDNADYKYCRPRMTPYVHFWRGGCCAPVPAGFELKLYLRNAGTVIVNSDDNLFWNHCGDPKDIIGFEILGLMEGWTW